jgi:hypothetical protein
MAGERLAAFIRSQGSRPSENADILYGTVISTAPLVVKIGTGMELTSNFIELGKYNKARNVLIDGEPKTLVETLSTGDSVSLVRGHGGQRFYILDRT